MLELFPDHNIEKHEKRGFCIYRDADDNDADDDHDVDDDDDYDEVVSGKWRCGISTILSKITCNPTWFL